jgi:hypothetical protein
LRDRDDPTGAAAELVADEADGYRAAPTAETTRLIEPLRRSPATNTQGTLVSSKYGSGPALRILQYASCYSA